MGGKKMKKEQDYNKEFNKLYDDYQMEVQTLSGGLVQTNKADFLKLYSFYTSVIRKDVNNQFEIFLKIMSK
jgi:hypothetical protein